jgi:hypothetical protein
VRFLTFWRLQAGGWLLYAAAMAVSYIPFLHTPGLVVYVLTFLGTAFLESFAMRGLCRTLWQRRIPFLRSLLCCLTASYLLGLSCSAIAVWFEIHWAGATTHFRWGDVLAGAIGGGFVFVTWSAFYFGIKHYQDLEAQKARLLAAEATARESQLRALRYQLQPHFLFNTLNTISSLVVSDQPRLATQMIARLADLLRSTLDCPDVHFVTLAEELSVMEEYLAIEKVRLGPRLQVSIEVSPKAQESQIPRFLLQPLIENTIRHGVSLIPEGGVVSLKAKADSNTVEIAIENDVRAVHDPGGKPGHGLGLENTRARIKHIYGTQADLAISGNGEGHFLISLTIPSTPPCGASIFQLDEAAP